LHDTWIADRMGVGRRDEGGQAAQEVERVEHETAGAAWMRPGPAQVVEDAVVGTQREALLGERRAEAIAAQPLEAFAVIGGHRLRGME